MRSLRIDPSGYPVCTADAVIPQQEINTDTMLKAPPDLHRMAPLVDGFLNIHWRIPPFVFYGPVPRYFSINSASFFIRLSHPKAYIKRSILRS